MILSERRADRLGVFSLGDVGWTDLGDLRRVMTVLSRTVKKKELHPVAFICSVGTKLINCKTIWLPPVPMEAGML
jgi:hypothetical protein